MLKACGLIHVVRLRPECLTLCFAHRYMALSPDFRAQLAGVEAEGQTLRRHLQVLQELV